MNKRVIKTKMNFLKLTDPIKQAHIGFIQDRNYERQRPVTAAPVKRITFTAKTRPRTCRPMNDLEDIDAQKRIRVDSAALFGKLAVIEEKKAAENVELLSESSPSLKKNKETNEPASEKHSRIMDAVKASIELVDKAPEIEYYIRKAYSAPIKGKDTSKILIKAKPINPLPDVKEEHEHMKQWIQKQGAGYSGVKKSEHVQEDLNSVHMPVSHVNL